MQNSRLDEAQAGIKIAGKNVNNLRYADDTTLMAENEEEQKSLLMRVTFDHACPSTPLLCTGRPFISGFYARGEGERVLALESREGTRASRRVEEGLSMQSTS